MSDITLWSNSAANNISASPNGFPEGMAPSGVDDACREVMAAMRRFVEDGGWFNWGHTCTRASGTTFTIPGNITTTYHIGRRVRVVGTLTGTIYGTITDSVYTTLTTITVSFDSGSMSNEAITVSLGYLSESPKPYAGATLAGNQTFTGVNTFSQFPVGPSSAPTTNYQLSNKKYVDDSVEGIPAFSPTIKRNAQTAAYVMQASDKAKVISCTNTWTLTVLPAATAGDGFYVWVRNNGSGIITLTCVNAMYYQSLATGDTTIVVNPGQVLLLQTDGTDWEVISSVGMGTPGEIRLTGRSTAPTGWLLCDGTEYDKNTYAALFAAIGYTFGVGTGNNFKIPDLRQKFPLGKAASGTGSTLGSTGGQIDHNHSHTHTVPAFTAVVGPGEVYINYDYGSTNGNDVSIGTNNPPYVVLNYMIKF